MAANQVHGGEAAGGNPDGDGPQVFLCVGLADGQTCVVSPELETVAPSELTQPSAPLGNFDQFRALWTAFYSTLIVKPHPTQVGVNIVATSFGSLTADQLQPIKSSTPALENVTKSPLGLYQTLRLLKQFEFLRTRTNVTALTEAMSDDTINTALGVSLAQPGDDNTQTGFFVHMYLRLITHILNSISHVHSKARAGLETYLWFQRARSELADLKVKTQDMLLALKTRSEANLAAQAVGSARQNCVMSLREFTSGVNQVHSNNALLYLNSLQVHQTFSFTRGAHCLETLVRDKSIWAHYFDIGHLDISTIEDLAQIGSDLDPLLDKIRSYQPSRLDDARDQAKNTRPNVIKLLDQIDLFFQSETKSRGTAKSIILQLDGLRTQLQKLQCDGLTLNVESIGSDQLTLESHYAKLTDYLSNFDQKQRLEETQRKLELQELSKASSNVQLKLRPLTGVSTWLQFNASMEEILQVHQSALVKAQMVRNALKVPEDQISCRDLSYDEIVSWLQNKYSDSSLLPKLCDELLLLPQSHDNFKTSYENLNIFFTTVHHLKKFEALERLEKSYRDKLVPILLAEIHQAAFLAKRLEKELEWKQELLPQDNLLPDDDQSIASESHDPALEGRRLQFFISQMKFFLPQAHQLSKTQKIRKSQLSLPTPRGVRNRTSYHHGDQVTHTCPVCLTPHIDAKGQTLMSLSRCQKFKTSLDVHARLNVVKRHNYCKRCLRPRLENDGIHDGVNCRIAQDKDMACKNHDPPNPSHHYLLCLSSTPDSQPGSGDQGQRGGGRGGYPRGRGGRGSSRGRGAGRGGSNQSHLTGQTQGAPPPADVVQFSNGHQLIPRLICHKLSSSQHITNNINFEKTRVFLSSACFVIALSLGTQVNLLSMMDSGSGMGFISETAVKLINPEPAKPWTGEISTLNKNQLGTWATYIVPLLDIFNRVHHVRLICTPNIGFKDSIPQQIFNDICSSFNVSPSTIQNTKGAFHILLGTDTFLLHGDRSSIKSEKFPDVCLMSSILSQTPYLVGSIGVRLPTNQSAITMSFAIQAKQPALSCWTPIAMQLMLNRNYMKSFFISLFLSKSCADEGRCCPTQIIGDLPKNSNSSCHVNHMQHVLSCSKAFICYETKKSAATIDLELSQPAPQVVCEQCHQVILKCQACKYISQSISIKDLEELNILRKCIRLEDQPDGRIKIYVSYPQKSDPSVIFSAVNSNYRAARQSSIRLRQTLQKRGLLDQFHIMMEKTLNDSHSELISFSPNDEPANYVSLNYQEKDSVSQSLRPVSNSSLPNKTGESLNSNSMSGPPWLGSGLRCLISFRENLIGYHSDISKFYRSVFTENITNNLRRYFWFTDPNNEQTLQCFRYIVGNYGDTSISILTEIIVREIISESCSTPEVAYACKEQRIVDDFCSSLESLQKTFSVREDLINTFGKFFFKIKHFHYSKMKLEPGQDSNVSVLGVSWNILTDELSIKTQLYPEKKRRGRFVGLELSRSTIKTLAITKEILARLCGLVFCYTGAFLAPVQASLRISYSRLCQVTQSWSTPCHVLDQELDASIRTMLSNISDMKTRIKPFPRHISAPGYLPYRIIASSDGAKFGLGFTYHMVSKDSAGNFISNIVLARPSVHKLSIPAAELAGLVKAVKSLDEVWSALQNWPLHNIELIFLVDSTCTANSLSLTKTFSDVRQRNSNITVHRIFSELVQTRQNLIIKVAHCAGINMPGDYLTRLVPDPVELINSDLYRHGNKVWGSSEWPSAENTYLVYQYNSPPKFFNAIPEQHSQNNCIRCSQPATLQQTAVMSSKENCDRIPLLSQNLYTYFFLKFSGLRKLLNVISILYSWNPSRRGWTNSHFDSFSFKVLVKSHQKIFGLPKQIKRMMPHPDGDGIQIATTRLDSVTGDVMNVNIHTPVLNRNDQSLINMLIYYHHCQPSGLLSKIHLGTTLTSAQIRSGPYAVFFPGLKAAVQKFVSSCAVCNYVSGRPQNSELSAPRFLKHLKNNDFVFRYLSIDDLGPFVRKPTPTSRSVAKYWVLIIADLLLGCCNFEIMEDRTRSSVHKALYNHCTTYNKEPFHVYSDGAAWISPDPSSDDFKKYFKTSFNCTQFKCAHQFLNKSERFTKIYKKLLRSALLERERVKMPNLTFTEIRCILGAIKSCINARPVFCSGTENYILTPNHFLHPHNFFDEPAVSLPDGENPEAISNLLSLTQSLEDNLKLLGNSLKLNHGFFIGLLKQMFSLDTAKSQQNKYKFIFCINDIVLILLSDSFCRGIVVTPGKQYASVISSKSRNREPENIHNSKMILLYREPTNGQQPAATGCVAEQGQPQLATPNQTKMNKICFSSKHINVNLNILN